MRQKIGEKLVLTLGLLAILFELLNLNHNFLADSPFLSGLATVFSIVFISWLWVKLVALKGKKEYDLEKETTQARIKFVNFDDIYKELCAEHREYLEKKRHVQRDRRVMKNVSLAILVGCVVGGAFYLVAGAAECAKDLLQIMLFAIIVHIASSASEKETEHEYKAAYKARIIPSLLKKISPSLKYDCAELEEPLYNNEFDVANFGLMEADVIEYIDKINGTINNKAVEMLELKLEHELDPENNKNAKMEIFNGIFAKIQTDMLWDYTLKLTSVGITTRVGLYEYGCKKIKMDNTTFMNNFNVQTNDKMLTVRILTSEIMEELLEYKLKYGVVFDMAIKNGAIYFLFYTGDMFEPDVLKDSMKKELILKDFSMLKMIIELMQKMDAIASEMQL